MMLQPSVLLPKEDNLLWTAFYTKTLILNILLCLLPLVNER
jgi:uncharacterized membrane protein YqaE (UPF0057 family)